MKSHRWSALALGIIMIGMAPLVAAMGESRTDPWPSLLASEPAAVDHDVAVLQLRANMALDRLIQSGRASTEKL